MRAVIVDDDDDMRQLLRLVMELDDIEVVGEAADACSGARCWKATSPDVLVVDHRMPGKDGLDLAEHVLGHDPDARILLFSSFLNDEAMARAEALGISAVLSKDELRRVPEVLRAS
jgi:DNA-binding NarL/FixJ family response regulator